MCYSKQIEGKEYLIITPGYISIDASISMEFKEKLVNIIAQEHYHILIDLVNVRYIDSIGLATIISALKELKNKGDIVLANLNAAVNTYFKLTRMDRVFSIIELEE
ncbi:MAG: STAS domain-containing protein [Bacteroidetes bacterium]|nr:STAS domain-containing protein [Bacteroidota bacterium]